MIVTYSLKHAIPLGPAKLGTDLSDDCSIYIDDKFSCYPILHDHGEICFMNTTAYYWYAAKSYRTHDSSDQRFKEPTKGTVITFTQTSMEY